MHYGTTWPRLSALLRQESPIDARNKKPGTWPGFLQLATDAGLGLRRLGAALVGTVAGVDFDPVVDVAEVGDFHFGAVAQLGRLHDLAGGIATGGVFGVG